MILISKYERTIIIFNKMSYTDIKEQSISVLEEGIRKILYQMNNCICKIYSNNGNIVTGYFCKILFNNNIFPVLIINNIMFEDIDNKKIIKLTINNEEKKIKIDITRKKYINPDLNISFIEIKPNKDKIYNYLELNTKNLYKSIVNLDYKNKFVYTIDYQNEKPRVSYNLINHIIDDKTIKYGSPILSLNTFEIIGIHYCNSHNQNINYDLFINNFVDLDNNKIIKLIINNEVKEIKIDNSRKKYKNTKNNIVIIEIKPNKDKIYNYLELDTNGIYKNESIYIMH